jgi:prolyl-tRNA editing enzyme YbaK/EbsC (Cys-tRNA(Pro) deacylase)
MALVQQIPTEGYLRERGVAYDVEMHADSASARAEARALHMPPDDVLKAILLKVGDDLNVAITTASRRLDIRRVRRLVHDEPVRLATETEIRTAYPGFELGALPPLPGLLGVGGFVDPSVLEHRLVAFADGRRTESILVNPRELFWGEYVWVAPITKDAFEDLRFEGDSTVIGDYGDL